jgi:hypothetical protein
VGDSVMVGSPSDLPNGLPAGRQGILDTAS